MPANFGDSPKAPAWLRPERKSGEYTSLPDHFFEGHDILADRDTRDTKPNSSGAGDLGCSPSQDRPGFSLPFSPPEENIQSLPATATPRGCTRTGGHVPRSASKRRRFTEQRPHVLSEAELETGMGLQSAAHGSSSVLGLPTSPRVYSISAPPRRSPRLHASRSDTVCPVRRRTARTVVVSSDRRRGIRPQHQASPAQGILVQLAEEQREEELSLQRLVTPKKQDIGLTAAPGSGRRLMQALLSEEAEQAAALDQLISPTRVQALPGEAPGSTSTASWCLGNEGGEDARLFQQHLLEDTREEVCAAGEYSLTFTTWIQLSGCREIQQKRCA